MKKIGDKEYFKIEVPVNILYLHRLLGVYTNPFCIKEDSNGKKFASPIEDFGEFKRLYKNGKEIYLEGQLKEEYEKQTKELIKVAKNILKYNSITSLDDRVD